MHGTIQSSRLQIENHPIDRLRSVGSNPVGTAELPLYLILHCNDREPIQVVGSKAGSITVNKDKRTDPIGRLFVLIASLNAPYGSHQQLFLIESGIQYLYRITLYNNTLYIKAVTNRVQQVNSPNSIW